MYITPALQYTTPANRCIVLPSQTRTCVSGAVNECHMFCCSVLMALWPLPRPVTRSIKMFFVQVAHPDLQRAPLRRCLSLPLSNAVRVETKSRQLAKDFEFDVKISDCIGVPVFSVCVMSCRPRSAKLRRIRQVSLYRT